MKKKFWSAGSIIGLVILTGSLISLYYVVTRTDFGATPPPFNELTMVSGQVEYVKWREWGESDSLMEIKLRKLPTQFQYLKPHEDEVSRALQKGVIAQFWVDPHDSEVWQVAIDGIIISPYQSRVAWEISNARLGKTVVSIILLVLTLISGMYLYACLMNLKHSRKATV
ncbi:MAG: hypothetical protein HY665_00775 [Chloroflexi bacterium]|nr:hypothetical protein [Chloroflexota bacterium]